MTTLRTYLAAKLTADGYEGLAGECCGCKLGNLAPCEAANLDECAPGYRHYCEKCPNWDENDDNECPMEYEGGWCVTASKGWPEVAP